jgi:hypothetical protein
LACAWLRACDTIWWPCSTNADYADQCRGSCRQRFFNTFVVSAVFKAPRVTASQ